jgi:elongation factor Ts
MSKVTLELIQKLREQTNMGVLDCKKALIETDGNIEKAVEILRKKGASVAEKRADKEVSQGVVHTYIHSGDKLGAMAEINCETDFVARLESFKNFAHDVCLQIAAMNPPYISENDIDPALIKEWKDLFAQELEGAKKPENIKEQIITNKLNKKFSELCLLKQVFVKDETKKIEDLLKELIAKTGENIKIRRFARFEIGSK